MPAAIIVFPVAFTSIALWNLYLWVYWREIAQNYPLREIEENVSLHRCSVSTNLGFAHYGPFGKVGRMKKGIMMRLPFVACIFVPSEELVVRNVYKYGEEYSELQFRKTKNTLLIPRKQFESL